MFSRFFARPQELINRLKKNNGAGKKCSDLVEKSKRSKGFRCSACMVEHVFPFNSSFWWPDSLSWFQLRLPAPRKSTTPSSALISTSFGTPDSCASCSILSAVSEECLARILKKKKIEIKIDYYFSSKVTFTLRSLLHILVIYTLRKKGPFRFPQCFDQ